MALKLFSTRYGSKAALLIIVSLLSGCAGFGRGVTEALLGNGDEKVDTRKCYVRGRPFDGLERFVAQQSPANTDNAGRTLKVLMVHGIGSHQPGYATRLAENLARSLSLDRTQERFKQFQLIHPDYPGETLGTLRVSAYLNSDGTKEMNFFELTWDPIVEDEKKTISFDNSGEYAFRRTTINNTLKLFVNETVPDVLMYNGQFHERAQISVTQAICRMMSDRWDSLPENGESYCDAASADNLDQLQDDYVFITHSLGSRITADALQRIATLAQSIPVLADKFEILQNKRFNVFMLSNQLPLLQLGQEKPEISGQIGNICTVSGARYNERLFKETQFVAFSDPNDLFSYAIPPKFMDEYMDSRLCPSLTNVILNIAPITSLLGMGEFANPMTAHTNYDNDERVLGLLTRGIGHGDIDPLVKERCEWLEAIPANGEREGGE